MSKPSAPTGAPDDDTYWTEEIEALTVDQRVFYRAWKETPGIFGWFSPLVEPLFIAHFAKSLSDDELRKLTTRTAE